MIPTTSFEFFTTQETKEGVNISMVLEVGVWDMLATMQETLALFKTSMNFTSEEFEDLTILVVCTIMNNVKSPSEAYILIGHPSKLNTKQHLLAFIL